MAQLNIPAIDDTSSKVTTTVNSLANPGRAATSGWSRQAIGHNFARRSCAGPAN
jgi:hypothetical protein